MSCTRWMAIWLYSAIFALALSLAGCKSQPQPAPNAGRRQSVTGPQNS